MMVFALVIAALISFNTHNQPKELGLVNWERDFAKAKALASESGKDILILFQEVPGCSTCQKYGDQILSDPLMVEVIETYFVPLAIYNNKSGTDKAVLDQYKEPSWNNPVLRLVDYKGKPIAKKLSGGYTKKAVLDYLIDHIDASPLPNYIRLMQQENNTISSESMYLSMYCFWTGEKVIGNMEGVVNTTAGFMHGREVVKVDYDPELVDPEDIVKKASKARCADQVFTENTTLQAQLSKSKYQVKNAGKFRLDKDQNYYLKKSKYASLQMTDLQAMKVNSALGNAQNPDFLLSPRQLAGLK